MKIRLANFIHKCLNWEYWPGYIVNIPAFLAWIWYAIKAQHLYFFSAANPVIETGGLWGESKRNILQRIPEALLPVTIYLSKESTPEYVKAAIDKAGLAYPVIAKPDIGERGIFVEKINTEDELIDYISKIRPVGVNYLIQEYIYFECELAVLYYRFPGDSRGKITSICIKEFLSITGDGVTTMRGLIEKVPRARFQLSTLEQKYGAALNNILPSGEKKMLVPIGNHRLGTTFLNGADLIDEQLTSVFDKISLQIEGMYYGRFDMRCKDLASLREGKTIKILEYNGVGSDPAHIYQPGYSFFRACRDYFYHWSIIYAVSRKCHLNGISYMTSAEAGRVYSNYKKVMKKMTS